MYTENRLNDKIETNICFLSSNIQDYGSDAYSRLKIDSIKKGKGVLILCSDKQISKVNSFLKDIHRKETNQVKVINLKKYLLGNFNITDDIVNTIYSTIDNITKDFKEINIFVDYSSWYNIIIEKYLDIGLKLRDNRRVSTYIRLDISQGIASEELSMFSKYGYLILDNTRYNSNNNLCIEEACSMYLTNIQKNIEESLHDIKNILAIVNGCANLALMETDNEKVQKYLNTILKSSLEFKVPLNKISILSHYSEEDIKVYDFDELVMEAVDDIDYIRKKGKI